MMAQHWMLAWQLCDFAGIRTSFAKKPYFCVFIRGGGGGGGVSTIVVLLTFMRWINFLLSSVENE